MTTSKSKIANDLNQQGANALLAAAFDFLGQNKINAQYILNFAKKYHSEKHRGNTTRVYRRLLRTFDDLGVMLATWFSDPKFLDSSGLPLPLSRDKGPRSVANLIRRSGARVDLALAVELMRQSPSIKLCSDDSLLAVRRVFVLRDFLLPRAAFVIERYFGTLQRNLQTRPKPVRAFLERSSYVSEADFSTIVPMLRDIHSRGTAFMDSIDGEIEGLRLRKTKPVSMGELGIHVFAWTKPTRTRKVLRKSRQTIS